MKHIEFQSWLSGLQQLTHKQRTTLEDSLHNVVSNDEIINTLEQGEPPVCILCGTSHPYRWGKQSGLQRLRCRHCHHCYTYLSETPLARLGHKDSWLLYSQALIDGLSVRKAAEQCHISKDISFRWRHRFLTLPKDNKPKLLQGIVEADETYFELSFKGDRHLNRAPHKRGHATHQVGTGAEKVPVLVIRDRQGKTTDFKLHIANIKEIEPLLKAHIAKDAVLCSDGASAYKVAAQHIGLNHQPVNLSQGRRVNGAYHIQNVNAYDSRLKGWMRRFNGVATKYLESYLGWRRLLEKWGQDLTPALGLNVALGREISFNC